MIIGVCGYKGAGKSTITDAAIVNSNYRRIGFADPLYAMLKAMGVPVELVDDKSKWNDPLDILSGKTLRYACRTLGTEWGRQYLGPNVWTSIAMVAAEEIVKAGNVAIIDNVRYWNEADAIRKRGGELIDFIGNEIIKTADHSSEQDIDAIRTSCRYVFVNRREYSIEESAKAFRTTLDVIVARSGA